MKNILCFETQLCFLHFGGGGGGNGHLIAKQNFQLCFNCSIFQLKIKRHKARAEVSCDGEIQKQEKQFGNKILTDCHNDMTLCLQDQ